MTRYEGNRMASAFLFLAWSIAFERSTTARYLNNVFFFILNRLSHFYIAVYSSRFRD